MEKYIEAEMEIVEFESEDVVTASCPYNSEGWCYEDYCYDDGCGDDECEAHVCFTDYDPD